MVVRVPQEGEPTGHLCIPQRQHAAVAGQIARAWGNEAFPAPVPRAEVCLAAERHDDGMHDFDADPDLDPETGMPRDFMRMPLTDWIECWRRGPAEVAEDSAYAGLLVSLHGEHLLGHRDLEQADPEDRELAEGWLSEQAELRSRLRGELEDDERLAAALDEDTVGCARKLIEVWDAISLALCVPRLPQGFDGVPCERRTREVEMREVGLPGGAVMVEVDPWPFSAGEVPLVATGRRLAGGYEDREELRAALAEAEPETLALTMVRREDDRGAA